MRKFSAILFVGIVATGAGCNNDARLLVQGQVTARLDTVNGPVNNVGFPFPNATRLDGPGASAAITGSCLISSAGNELSTIRFFQDAGNVPHLEQVTIATRVRQNMASVSLIFNGVTYTGSCAATATRYDRSSATLSMTNCQVLAAGTSGYTGQVNAELAFEGCSVVASDVAP